MAFSLADRINKPTEKQLDFIAEIEKYVGDTFDGETRREASEWIDEHLDEYNLKRDQYIEYCALEIIAELNREESRDEK